MTDDFEILLHWGIVPQYRQSIAFRNSLLGRVALPARPVPRNAGFSFSEFTRTFT